MSRLTAAVLAGVLATGCAQAADGGDDGLPDDINLELWLEVVDVRPAAGGTVTIEVETMANWAVSAVEPGTEYRIEYEAGCPDDRFTDTMTIHDDETFTVDHEAWVILCASENDPLPVEVLSADRVDL